VFSRRGYFPNPRESRALALRLRAVLEAVLSLAAAVADIWNDGERTWGVAGHGRTDAGWVRGRSLFAMDDGEERRRTARSTMLAAPGGMIEAMWPFQRRWRLRGASSRVWSPALSENLSRPATCCASHKPPSRSTAPRRSTRDSTGAPTEAPPLPFRARLPKRSA